MSLSNDLFPLDGFSKVVLVLHCMDDYHFGRAYQLPPYSMVVHFLDDYRNMKRLLSLFLFIYLFFSYGAWSSAPHWLRSGGCGSSQCHVFDFYWLECLVSGECLFSFPALSKAESFDFLAFPFSISPFSVRLFSPTRILLLTSSVFSLTSRYTHPHLRFSFLSDFSLHLCHLSSFSSLHYPFFLLSGGVSFFFL